MRQLGRLSVTASWGATFFNNASSSSYVDLASSRHAVESYYTSKQVHLINVLLYTISPPSLHYIHPHSGQTKKNLTRLFFTSTCLLFFFGITQSPFLCFSKNFPAHCCHLTAGFLDISLLKCLKDDPISDFVFKTNIYS